MKHKIGITGTGSLIGQAILKSIIRSEYKDDYSLTGFDYFPDTVGSYWCQKNFILPDIKKETISDTEWVEALVRIIKSEELELLFVGVDFELPILAIHKKSIELETGCIIIVSDQSVIDTGNDKYLTAKFLENSGLPFPLTYLPEEVNFDELEFPVIIKPRVGHTSIGVYKIKDKEELVEKLKLVNGPVIQELVGDDTTEYTCGVLCFNGELKASIALNRTLKAGNTFTSEYKKDSPEAINQYLKDIVKHLKPFGSCNLQLRLGKDGVPKLFEINPRHSGTTYMRSLFGYNEIIYILRFVLEGKETPFNLKEGKVIRHFEETLL